MILRCLVTTMLLSAMFMSSTERTAAQSEETLVLGIGAFDCDVDPTENQNANCVPNTGAEITVTLQSGEFIGSCTMEVFETPNGVGSVCVVEGVPADSTVIVTEDESTLPSGYVATENPQEFQTNEILSRDGEGYDVTFTNVLVGQAQATTTSSRGTSRGRSSSCELVELYPGYPGYRGYITGLDGIGDHECLNDLEAMDPSFSRQSEDSQNTRAARALDISGSMNVWTWENWMAIEAERGMQPACYACLLFDGPGPEPNGASVDVADPRILIGTSMSYLTGDTTALSRLSQKHGVQLQGFASDQHFRALVGLLYAGRHLNAAQMLEAYDEVVEMLYARNSSGNFQYLDVNALSQLLLDQGGYAPTPEDAYPEDQLFLFFCGIFSLQPYYDPYSFDLVMSRLDRLVAEWELERSSSGPTLSFAEFLRREKWGQ